MLKKHLLFAAGLCLLAFIGCKDDESQDVVKPTGQATYHTLETSSARIAAVITKETVTTDVNVTVRNTSGQFINGATVTIEGNTATTDVTGKASFDDLIVNSDYLFVVGEKDGFEKCQKTITSSTNGTTNVELRLLADVPEQTFTSSTATELTFGSVKLDFPVDAIEDANGDAYTGEVTVNTVYFDPSSDNFASTAPGNLVGISASDEAGALRSYGMLTVDLTDVSGNTLNIADGKTVDITMPAAADAPVSIPLWHLNETYGLWTEVGTATKVGDEYKATVSHFSSYNLDVKVDAIDVVSFIVKDNNGNFLVNQSILLKYQKWGDISYEFVTSDNQGEFKLLNAPIGNMSFVATVGGAEQTRIKDLQSTGKVTLVYQNCDGCYVPMALEVVEKEGLCLDSGGMLTVNVLHGEAPYAYTWSNGGTSSLISDLSEGVYTVTVVDNTQEQVTASYELIASDFAISILEDFSSCNLYTAIKGVKYPISYEWSTGGTSSSFSLDNMPIDTYTVTATNGDGCIASAEYQLQSLCTPINLNTINCGENIDVSAIELTGVVGVSYLWSTGSTTETEIFDAGGTYTVTVTDSLGGTVEESIDIVEDFGSPSVVVNSSSYLLTCANPIVDLTATASSTSLLDDGLSYSWAHNAANISTTISIVTAGTYTVTVTDEANFCTAVSTIEISQDFSSPVIVAAPLDVLSCVQDVVNLDISETIYPIGPVLYHWSGESSLTTAGNGSIESTISPGTYTVTVTDVGNGCYTTSELNVAQDISSPTVSITKSNDLSESNPTVDLTVSSDIPASYDWSNGATTEVVTVTQSGAYTVTVTSASSGCTQSASIVVLQE